MDERGIAARIRDMTPLQRRAHLALLLLAYTGLGWWGLNSTTTDIPIAIWWPAAAMAVVALLASRGRRVLVALALVALGVAVNLAADRGVPLSAAYGVANVVEAVVVVWMLERGRPWVRMVTLPETGWFLVSAGVGAAVMAVLGGSAAAVLGGADLLVAMMSLFTSHASAIFALVPVFLVPLTVRIRVPVWEPVVQTTALVLLTFVVFAPAATLGLTFLIITTLMWGAFRLPPLVPALQTIALAFVTTIVTGLSGGPFSELVGHDPRAAVIALQLFIMTHAAAGLFVAGQSHDWNSTTQALAAREREAQKVADELRLLNQQKDDFISAVSHELRTPVTSIIGFSEQLVDDQQLDAETKQAGQVIYRNARRLADVIEDVLELSRLSTQVASSRAAEDVDLVRLLAHCIEDTMGIVPPTRDVQVELRGADHPITLRVVEQDLVRVVSNLLSNAIKFSPPGGVVTVTVSEHPDDLRVSIADQGPGVPPAEQDAIWERFYRVQTARHRGVPGTGLGLPIVRSLMTARIGGDVTLTSDGENGTTVTLRIPRAPTTRTASIQRPPT
jgi:signal transduction histidine kinase